MFNIKPFLFKNINIRYFSTHRRVVITGLGMVSPLGVNVQSSWKALLDSQSGIKRIKDIEAYKNDPDFPDVTIAPIHKDFDKKKWQIPFTNNLTNSFALAATAEALNDANWLPSTLEDKQKTGVSIGIMGSNMDIVTKSLLKVGEKKSFDALNRLMILHVLNNMPSSQVSIKYNLQGPMNSCGTACATGASAIIDGYKSIQTNEADVMIVGGSEDTVNPTIIHSCIKMQAMCIKQFNTPQKSSCPFDEERAGFVLGEGSGILVLEELEHALKRNAKIYAEVTGYGCTSDGYHLTRPLNNGDGAYRAMQKALSTGNCTIEQLDHINTHCTSTPAGDIAEANAIFRLLLNQESLMKKVSITANKSAIGHCFGAAGSIESIFTIMSIKEGISPRILNLEKPIPDFPLNYTKDINYKQEITYALKNSFGFGGVNVSILFKKWGLN